jgi:selenocysteine-specific elongation factor
LAAAVEVAGRGGIGVRELPVRLGIPPDDVGPLVEDMIAGGAHEVSGRLYAGKVIDDARRTMIATLEGYHKQHPLEPGMPRELLRASLDDLQLGAAVPDMLVAAGELAYDGGTVRSAAFRVQLDAGQAAAVARIEGIVGKQGGQGSTVGELEAEVTGAQRVAEFLVRDGKLVRIGGDRYYATDSLAHVRDQILHHIRESGRGAPSELRVVTGLTRKYLIPILEWMDARGYTRREGDERKLGPKADRPDD